MHQQLIQSIVEEVRSDCLDNFLGKIFQLSPLSFAVDLGVKSRFLFISAEPASPRFYLVQRRVKELDKQTTQLSHFGQLMKSLLGGGRLIECSKDLNERIVRLTFRVEDDLGAIQFRRLVVQLTGRAANVFMLDELSRIITALRQPKGYGQNIGDYYSPPPSSGTASEDLFPVGSSPSESADEYFQAVDATKTFDSLLGSARAKLRQQKNQKTKLKNNLERDLKTHGDPDSHKRVGDLLLANVSTAIRHGSKVTITDFYSDDTPALEIDVDENVSLQEAATKHFRQYTKAKRAQEEIAQRLESLGVEIAVLEKQESELDRISHERDEQALAELTKITPRTTTGKDKPKRDQQIPGVRRYVSSDGYEILVGRNSRDNDNLTFRIARPSDLWFHAGDYPGSHVIVRNPTRKEIPQRTVIEAAQLAGRFSQASDDAKVVIHYSERKFLSKPKGAAPGLVRMSSFRSITVEPKEAVSRM